MRISRSVVFLAAALWAAITITTRGHADTIKVLAIEPMRPALVELQPRFEAASGHTLVLTFGEAAKVRELVSKEPFDLLIAPDIGTFIMEGKVRPASRVDVAKAGSALYSSGILSTSGHADRARTLQTFFATPEGVAAIKKNGMDPAR